MMVWFHPVTQLSTTILLVQRETHIGGSATVLKVIGCIVGIVEASNELFRREIMSEPKKRCMKHAQEVLEDGAEPSLVLPACVS